MGGRLRQHLKPSSLALQGDAQHGATEATSSKKRSDHGTLRRSHRAIPGGEGEDCVRVFRRRTKHCMSKMDGVCRLQFAVCSLLAEEWTTWSLGGGVDDDKADSQSTMYFDALTKRCKVETLLQVQFLQYRLICCNSITTSPCFRVFCLQAC